MMRRRANVAKEESLPFDGKLQVAESTLDPWSSVSADSDEANPDALALFRAIVDGNLKVVQLILDKSSNTDLLKTRHRGNETCLHLSVRKQHYKIVEYLLDRMLTFELHAEGSPHLIDAHDGNTGDTALHIAARLGDLKLVDLLIRYGADPDLENHRNDTPNSIAMAKKAGAIVRSFNTRYDFMTPRTKAVADNGIRVTIARVNHRAKQIPFEDIPFEDIQVPLGVPPME